MKQAIKSTRILTEGGWIDGYVLIEEKRIKAIVESINEEIAVIDYGNQRVIPGIIDIHNHGFGGWSMTDPATEKEVAGFAKAVASVGVTTVLPTAKEEAFEAIATWMQHPTDGARVFGIHSEGPFWARGGENTVGESWPLPSVEEAKRLVEKCHGQMKMMAIAPELEGAYDVIRYLHDQKILVASAHTKANAAQIQDAVKYAGLDIVTHLCNGMQGIHHRDAGALGAYLLEDQLYYELITDLNHVCPDMIRLVFRCQPYDKFLLISDSNYIAGLPSGKYIRYNKVMLADEKGLIKDLHGRICGSGKYVLYNMKQLDEVLHIPFEKISQMASLNPARFLSIAEETGSLRAGKYADLIVISDEYECEATYVEGKLVYRKHDEVFNQEALNKRIGDLDCIHE